MLSILSILLFLIVFFVFVRWDRRRIEQSAPDPDTRQKMQKGYNASKSAKYQATIGVSAISAVSGVFEWLHPNLPPFAGRWSWLHIAVYEALGTYGMAIVTTIVSVAFAISAWSQWENIRRPTK